MKRVISLALVAIVFFGKVYSFQTKESKPILQLETGLTISKVRTAQNNGKNYIIGSSYEGTIIAVSYEGKRLWENKLSGFMNHDIWCADVTNDGNDEIFAANADGTIYCMNTKGRLLWEFRKNNAPMYAVTTISKGTNTYVVCGGYDKNIYYLSSIGSLVKTISSYDYSKEKPWGAYPKEVPKGNCHISNFIRTVKKANGKEILAVQGINHSMAIQARGSLYLFNPLEDMPFKTIDLQGKRLLGELKVVDVEKDGNQEIIAGSSTMIQESSVLHVNLDKEEQRLFDINAVKKKIDRFGYRVTQPEIVLDNGHKSFFVLFGSRILMVPLDFSLEKTEVLVSNYSFNDMWKDNEGNIVLASIQSGGSEIYVINLKDKNWKQAYENLEPKGKVKKILANTKEVREQLKDFKSPEEERSPLPVYLMSESIPEPIKGLVNNIKKNYNSPVFLNRANSNKEKWDRSSIKNERYRERRDRRMKYILSQDQIVKKITSKYKGAPGIAYWGGHGNDPYMYQLSTTKKVLNAAQGKKTVLVFPELEDHSDNFNYVMEDYFYPLAKHARETNGNIYVRTKHAFWYANVYLPTWSKLVSGEFSDVFIPAMEETTDKSMDLSIAGRLGIWASGATDSWGSRCARDNPSLDRLRQHSHQMLPNHFLRNMIYHVSNGAQYLDNFNVDQEYMSLLWELIAKGVLYVPERSEIVSFSPVHLSMLPPDDYFLEESSNTKWTTFYNEEKEKNNPLVFSHLNGSWPGAPVTDWDFSKYAGGVKDRRLNFLPTYTNGLVLLTPPQEGVFADKKAKRGKLTSHLHPIYKNIMKEFYTDGRNYYSADGKQTFKANEYYSIVENEIKKNATKIPITVSGEVAWVAAQSSSKKLRLTLIDGGYLNPDDREVVIQFNDIRPIKVTDLLSGEEFKPDASGQLKLKVSCGLFRFMNIEFAGFK
ncbi:WD40 repeat domain-containing protein [uncultured Maribacter sp.]|uniref:WD40 repeat domain-containing protein n=1 Tax=uncultured Maribacter sp. TaxID=431308 RepID=UPI0026206442|nr:WD40 repeat domain-containing protein [uncultured Maribacter sp.]